MAQTAKQKAIEEIQAAVKADPSLSVTELCEKHGVSPAYYYNSYRRQAEKKAEKKSTRSLVSVPRKKAQEVVTYNVNDLAPQSQPSFIPPGYAAVVLIPSDQLLRGLLFARGPQ